ncbi:MAG: PilZ domain-containing protein [Desulfobacteraceae bacterium]|nr:PilZ domain-containing protein [Desulfobacteraceae bacterium]
MSEDFYGLKRKHERKGYRAEIVFAHKDRAYNGSLKDISVGGAFVETASVNQFSVGDLVILNIPYTTGKKIMKRKGRIQWQNNVGFAVEFL